MILYNIYYKSNKINKIPLRIEEVKHVIKEKYIYHKNSDTGELEKISPLNLEYRKLIVV